MCILKETVSNLDLCSSVRVCICMHEINESKHVVVESYSPSGRCARSRRPTVWQAKDE